MMAQAVSEPKEASPAGDVPALSHKDVRGINQRLARLRAQHGNVRVKQAFFRCPWPCTRLQYEKIREAAVRRWITWMEKQGWDLVGKVAVDVTKRRPAYGYSGDWASVPLLDQAEIPVAALFKVRRFEMKRIEVPVADS